MTIDHAAHLSAILAQPDEDAPRLIYADWLEEQGEQARADFIRVQVELAKMSDSWESHYNRSTLPADHPIMKRQNRGKGMSIQALNKLLAFDNREQALRQQERELLTPHWHDWSGRVATYCANFSEGGAVGVLFKRGFVDVVTTTLDSWMGGPCAACDGVGILDQVMNWCRCITCHGTGRIPGVGPALVRQQPVRQLILSWWVVANGSGNPIRLRSPRNGEQSGRPWELEVRKGRLFSVDEFGEVEVVLE